MTESIQIAAQVYLMGFAISMLIAAIIKGIMVIISRMPAGKKTDNN